MIRVTADDVILIHSRVIRSHYTLQGQIPVDIRNSKVQIAPCATLLV